MKIRGLITTNMPAIIKLLITKKIFVPHDILVIGSNRYHADTLEFIQTFN